MKNLSINYKKTIFKPLFLTVRFTMLSAKINVVIKIPIKDRERDLKNLNRQSSLYPWNSMAFKDTENHNLNKTVIFQYFLILKPINLNKQGPIWLNFF